MENTPETESAVIDRFEGHVAVLLVGNEQRVVDVPRDHLPPGVQPGQWLRIRLDGEALLEATVDADTTEATRRRIAEKLARLRRGDHLR
jgi:hypothetical protein